MGVEFNEDKGFSRVGERTPKLAAWLISRRLAKDVAGANKIQIVISIVCFALAIFFATR